MGNNFCDDVNQENRESVKLSKEDAIQKKTMFFSNLIKINENLSLQIPKIAQIIIQQIKKHNQFENIQNLYKLTYPRLCYIYVKIFNEELPTGQAIIYFINEKQQFQSYYEGMIVNGIVQDKNGIYVEKNGGFYKGQIINQKAKGVGSYKNVHNHIQYQGNWEESLPHGQGIAKTSKGVYEGNFVKGKMCGKGNFQWENGNKYSGQFDNDALNGKGELVSQQFSYEGYFKDGQCSGFGKWMSSNQSYEGQFHQGKKSGKGVFKFTESQTYQGDFADNLPHGLGILTKDGDKYEGLWLNGKNIWWNEKNKFTYTNKQQLSSSVDSSSS